MAIYLTVDKDGTECVFDHMPIRFGRLEENPRKSFWQSQKQMQGWVELPKGTIEKIIGKKLTWSDDYHVIEDDKE